MASYNIWAFLIKQQKYKTWPLLVFYVLAILLSISRLYYSFWYFYVQYSYGIIGHLSKPILVINLGVVQCWMLFELSLRLKENLDLSKQFA